MPDASHNQIAYCAMLVFANDGVMDNGEFHFLLGLAMRDETIDDEEKRVLADVFERAEKQSTLDAKVREKIEAIRKKHNF